MTNPTDHNHPDHDVLTAFGLGKLDPPEAESVEQHIAECEPCCETLLHLQDDTFVETVRRSKDVDVADQGDDASIHTAAYSSLAVDHTSDRSADELPHELANHSRYRLVEHIGRGGMGDVYKAEHRLMDRLVALKVIKSHLLSKPEAVKRFQREVQAAARLSHPNIVTAYDAEQAGDFHFLVMEYVDGLELSEVVNQRGPLPVAEAADYIRQAAAGLQHAHEMGMVHRDIKPQNLMLDEAGNIKILDFGLANFASESATEESSDEDVGEDSNNSAQPARLPHQLTQLGTMMGTPDYIAPEQARDARSADIRSDIYSLGCTLYYLLAGKVPFPGNSVTDKLQSHAEGKVKPIRELRGDLPEGLEDVLQRLMSQDPDERFQTPAEAVEALRPYIGSINSERPPANSWGTGSRQRFQWVATAIVAALLCGAIVVMTNRGRVEIQSGVDNVKVIVSQGGREIKVLDVDTGTSVYWLPSGDYQVSVSGDGAADVTIGPNTVTIARFGKELIQIHPDPAVQANQQLQGTWIAASGERGGKPLAHDLIGVQQLDFMGDRILLTMPGGMNEEIAFTLDVEKDPHQIRFHSPDDSREMRGIYKVQEDRLTLCVTLDPALSVPTEFATDAGTPYDLIVFQKGLARPEIRQELMALINAARPNLSDEELKRALTSQAPLLSELNIEAARALVSMLTGLTDKAHQALLQEGYLKWRFKSLDEGRQSKMQTFVRHLLAPAEKMGFPAGTAQGGQTMLDKGSVGFAVLTDPDTNDQLVAWYLLMTNAPMPMMFPLVGLDVNSSNVMASRQLHDQLFELVDKPESDLPTIDSPSLESTPDRASQVLHDGDRENQLAHVVQGTVTRIFSNMTAGEYRAMDHGLRLSNHRPVQLTGHVVDGESRFAVIWKQDPDASFASKAYVDLSPAQFQERIEELVKQGFRLIRVSAYVIGNEQRYAGIFEQRDGPAWQAQLAVPEDKLPALSDELSGQGYRMLDVSGFDTQEGPLFATVWEQSDGPDWQSHPALTASEIRMLSEKLSRQGFRPLRVSGYCVESQARYASIWEQAENVQWRVRVDMRKDEYARTDKEFAEKGYGKVQLSELHVGDEPRYAVIWQRLDSARPATPESDSEAANAPAGPTPVYQLVKNSGFEESGDKEGTQATYWLPMRKTTADEPEADCRRDTETFKTGSASAAIIKERVKNRLAETGFLQNVLDLPTGRTLRLTGNIKTENVKGSAAIKLRLRDPNKSPARAFLGMCETRGIQGTREWQSCDALIQVPPGAVGELGLVLQGTGAAWFDDVRLTPIPTLKASLVNGGFEDLSDDRPIGWQPIGAAAEGVTMAVDKKIRRTGAASVMIKNEGRDIQPYNWRQELFGQLPVGKNVELTGWVKTKNAKMVAVAVQVLDESNGMIAFHTTQNRFKLHGTADWRAFTLRFPIPPKTSKLAILAMLSGNGQVWFDDFQLDVGASPKTQD